MKDYDRSSKMASAVIHCKDLASLHHAIYDLNLLITVWKWFQYTRWRGTKKAKSILFPIDAKASDYK